MPIYSQQEIKRIHIDQLKNLKNVEIDFSGTRLTALMGINGSGKTTILHALACCYKPQHEGKTINYKFSQYFTPTPDSRWRGSHFTLYHDYRMGPKFYTNNETVFSKNEDRWSPKYDRRIARDVYYIGINTGVPKIEEEKRYSYIKYTTIKLDDVVSMSIKENAGTIMNRDYASYNLVSDSKGKYIGVEYNQSRYSSLSMSAGEQRVFKILSDVINAPKNSLILIDEIDMLLHVFALKRLIKFLYQRAEQKKLQIVFTTHSIDILNYSALINIKHLYNTPEKTICFTDAKPDTIYRITGENTRPFELFVEDDLAFTIVNSVIESLNMSQYVNVVRFGPAINCFTTAAGLMLSGKLSKESLFILDGDLYVSKDEKVKIIQQVLTGTTVKNDQMREELLDHITQLKLPEGYAPEYFIHCLLKDLSSDNQIIKVAKEIQKVENAHKYVDDIIHRMGYQSREVGLSKIIDIVSRHQKWEDYTSPVRNWLNARKRIVLEETTNEDELQAN